MYRDLRYQVNVVAQATYIDEQSNVAEGRFVFTYTVTIHNEGTLPAQLLHRYWKITDGEGAVREVHGDGVVGEQPTIVPGDAFTYTSVPSSKPPLAPWKAILICWLQTGSPFKPVFLFSVYPNRVRCIKWRPMLWAMCKDALRACERS